jgi:beta-1,4-mannosyl-glycoprotein beta-1,4-N-acetylglucosaminyltransferase
MNCQNTGESRWWKGCIAATGRQFKEITPQGLRNNRDVYPSKAAGGWHFSFLGGAEKISYKIKSYAHTEYNKEEFFDEKHIEESILKGADVLKRKGVVFKFMPLSYYPVRLQKFMKMYPGLLHLKKTGFFTDLYFFIRRIIKGNI